MQKTYQPMDRRVYGKKCLRNFLIAALVALLLWIADGYPLPRKVDFRRMERQRLLGESEIVLEIDGRVSGDRDFIVGVTDTLVHAAKLSRGENTLVTWEKEPGRPVLISLPGEVRYWNKGSYLGPAFVAVEPPMRAVSARLVVTLDFLGEINDRPVDWEEVYTVEGERRGNCFFFQMMAKYEHEAISSAYQAEQSRFWAIARLNTGWPEEMPPYTLTFFDAGGNVVEELTGRAND